MKNFKWRAATETMVVISTCLSCLVFFTFLGMSMILRNAAGCFWYGLGLFTSSVALAVETDAWLPYV